jgi:hypothetical protein
MWQMMLNKCWRDMTLLAFCAYVEHPKWISDVTWLSVVVRPARGLWNGLEIEFDLDSNMTWTSLLFLHASKTLSNVFLIIFMVPNNN